ncbi:MAG: hypothetical protein WKH68_08705 [Candidatus Limnocylindria bacterium]
MTSDVVLHDFPSPHRDFLTQFIDYRVPVEMFSALGEYDGSCLVDRTAGEAAARCDSEAANLLTLNLMHEIITGKRTVADARETYAQSLVGYTMGRATPYCEKFLFDIDAYGEPNESTDTRLHLSDVTVRNCLSEAIGKLVATKRVAAARLARERGWL